MELSFEIIAEKLKNPPRNNKALINNAVAHESRLDFHGRTAINANNVSNYIRDFIAHFTKDLSAYKKDFFKSNITYPIVSVSLVDSIFIQLFKVFDAQDFNEQFLFSNDEIQDDFNNRIREYKIKDWLKNDGMNLIKTAINTIIVVDRDSDDKPFFFPVNVADIRFFNIEDSFQFNHIAINIYSYVLGDTIYTSDAERQYIAIYDSKNVTIIEEYQGKYAEINKYEHGNKFGCPARTLWSDPLENGNNFNQQAPHSSQLSLLDEYVSFYTDKKNNERLNSYNIINIPNKQCDYETEYNEKNSDTYNHIVCKGGYLYNEDAGLSVIDPNGDAKECPICQSSGMIGPGSVYERPYQTKNEDVVEAQGVEIIGIERDSLDYNNDELDRKYHFIYKNILGFINEDKTGVARNIKDVMQGVETRLVVFQKFANNLEKVYFWINKTVTSMLYGDSFTGVTGTFGRNFLMFTITELRELYDLSKKAGASENELDSISEQIMLTENKNNSATLQRQEILAQLEPFRHKTFAEAKELMDLMSYDTEIIDDFKLKVNFSKYINRFERENGSVVDYAQEKSFDVKIAEILKELKKYTNEQPKRENSSEKQEA